MTWETHGQKQMMEDTHKGEQAKESDEEPDTTSQTGKQRETNKFETAEKPDTTSQTGRQMSSYKGRHINSRQPKSRTPPARLGDK